LPSGPGKEKIRSSKLSKGQESSLYNCENKKIIIGFKTNMNISSEVEQSANKCMLDQSKNRSVEWRNTRPLQCLHSQLLQLPTEIEKIKCNSLPTSILELILRLIMINHDTKSE
jgi:hypothetical protein